MLVQDGAVLVPICDHAGIAGTAAGFEKVISIGALNSVTSKPESAQRAVTWTICVPGTKPGPAGPGVNAQHEDVVLRVGRCRPRGGRHPHRDEPTGECHREVAGCGDAALHRRRIHRRRVLDRDRDTEQRAGAAGILELAGEDMQAVRKRAGREGERRARDDRCGRRCRRAVRRERSPAHSRSARSRWRTSRPFRRQGSRR